MTLRRETKTRARTLQILYAAEFGDNPLPDRGLKNVIETEGGNLADAAVFAKRVAEKRDELDEVVAEQIDGWRLKRVGVIERNILRLALYELLHTDTPAKVVIDEAVRLAQWFAGEKGPSFVNGVLDALAKRYEKL
ncbi:MAG: transcription antitermination factor NusB [Gemmatimonadota bacterium]|nr:transcription antitermination factor NusB [Gemmatimonadota bacterium]